MNKKILVSLGIIVAVVAVVITGTVAFFSDTETSAGNIFTAGSIDLKVDHTRQTYNGIDCKTCSVDVYSSLATNVVAASVGASEQGPFPVPAVDVSNPHPAWQDETALAPAQWIWATDPTTVDDTTNGAEYTFENKFQWNGSAVSVDLDLALAADNGYKVILNGTTIVDKLLDEFNYGSAVSLTGGQETTFMGAMVNGENTLDIIVRNKPLAADPVTGNPGGLLFKLNIHRDAAECAADSVFQRTCRLWQEKDLAEGDKFFNFDDVKPGDLGTNVISLRSDSNDAWACLLLDHKVDLDNTVVEPELDLSDDDVIGELSPLLSVFTWGDDGNGVYDSGESAIGALTNMGALNSLAIAEPPAGPPLPGNTTQYIGLVWCAGTLDAPVAGSPFVCDGSTMGNIAQTDSFSADVILYATQSRNNPDFRCARNVLPI